jgi:hypothetical protein
MNGHAHYPSLVLPMFDANAHVWDGLDETTQAQVLDGLGLLFLRHLQQTAGCIAQERTSTKGSPK